MFFTHKHIRYSNWDPQLTVHVIKDTPQHLRTCLRMSNIWETKRASEIARDPLG